MSKRNNNIKYQELYQNLQEHYEEMNDYLLGLIADHKCAENELRYLKEFIHYKKLDEEFHFFKEHSHEEYEPDIPLPYLTL